MAAVHLTAPEVVERLRLDSLNALYQRVKRGTAPAPIRGAGPRGGLLFPLAAVEKWEREHTT